MKEVRSVSEREATARKYSGSCSECLLVDGREPGREMPTVVIAAELDELVLERGED